MEFDQYLYIRIFLVFNIISASKALGWGTKGPI
jgi:hypothetical protein